MTQSAGKNPKVASREEWLAARKELLVKEKQLTRQSDALAAERRNLPWVKVDKEYAFDTPKGKKTLADLFDHRSQLIVYHFMFGPEWKEGCHGCSMISDQHRRWYAAPGEPGCDAAGGVARAPVKDRGIQETHGLEI